MFDVLVKDTNGNTLGHLVDLDPAFMRDVLHAAVRVNDEGDGVTVIVTVTLDTDERYEA